MRIEISRLHDSLDCTTIYVTHDQVEAMTLADKIVVLKDGKVEQTGEPMTLYNEPANLFVAKFIGSPPMNFIQTKIQSVDLSNDNKFTIELNINGLMYKLPSLLTESREITLGCRPEHIVLASSKTKNDEGIQFEVTVDLVERLGDVSYLYTHLSNRTDIVVTVSGQSKIKKNDKVNLFLPNNHIHLFDEYGKRINNTRY